MISIEDSILKSLIYNVEYANKVMPYLDDTYFVGSHQTLFGVYKDLYDKYKSIPTVEAMAVTLQTYSIVEHEFEEITKIVSQCISNREDLPDTQWLIDQTEEFCRDKKIFDAVTRTLNIIDGSDKELDKYAIPELLEDALAISFSDDVGQDYFSDASSRYDFYTSEDSRLKFPLNALNILSNGGHKKKALSCVLAGVNVGKSSIMCYLSGEFLKMGKNVLYISLEMAEEDIYERIDANLLDISTDKLKLMRKDDFISKIESVQKKTIGKLFAKQYPTGQGHAGHFKLLIKELKQKKRFHPDIIFIDYLNICASSRYKSMSGVNSYSYMKAIAEELRGLAVELDTCMMTATQVNRDGFKDKSPDMTATSESWGVPASLDFFVAITTDEVLQENGQQLIHPLKTRWGNKSKLKSQIVNIDFDKMRYSDVGSHQELASKVASQDKAREKLNTKRKTEGIDFNVE